MAEQSQETIEGGQGARSESQDSTATTTTTTVASRKRKAQRPRSEVWEHFTKFVGEQGDAKSKCNYCGREYVFDSKNGTSSMRSHLNICKDKPIIEESTQSLLNFKKGSDKSRLSNWKFDQEVLRKSLARMIIVDELPFKFVERVGFIEFMLDTQPRFKIPSRFTVARDCFALYLDEKLKLKEYFCSRKQRVSLTTDTWTSIQRVNYMCLTAHFIDDTWTLRKKILNFVPVSSHKGQDIGVEIETCLNEWAIDKVMTISVNNAGSNDVAIKHMQEQLIKRGNQVMNCEFLHMRCVAHILNLIVNDGIKQMGTSVKRVREAVRFIRQSPLRMRKFKECCIEEKIQTKKMLCLDVPTRWNSTYLMLDTAQKFEEAFKRYKLKDPYFEFELDVQHGGVGEPDVNDWKHVKRLAVILGYFYNMTLHISSSLFVTSNTFFPHIFKLHRVLDEWKKSDDLETSNIAKNMKEKYDKYWGNPMKINKLLYVAVVLDPRYKLRWVKFALAKMYPFSTGDELGWQVEQVVHALYHEYNLQSSSTSTQVARELVTSATRDNLQVVDDEDDPNVRLMKMIDMEEQSFMDSSIGTQPSRTEMERYLNEEMEARRDDFDILGWWKINCHRFPILSKMARDVLAMPISTVASESTFSTGGRVLDSFKSSLSPKLVQSLICAQDWLRQSLHSRLEDDEEGDDDLQKMELDLQKIALEATVDVI